MQILLGNYYATLGNAIRLFLIVGSWSLAAGGSEHDWIRSINEDKPQSSWEELELLFLAKVEEPKLHSSPYHVIRASLNGTGREDNNSSYIIHLTKPAGLFDHEKLGLSDNEARDMDCVFTGTLTEVETGQSGTVSFSSGHDGFGFEGLILLPHEQYYIKPSPSRKLAKRSLLTPNSNSDKPTIRHKALRVNRVTKLGNIDVIMKPTPEDLLAADQAQSERDMEDLESSTTSNPDPDLDMENGIDSFEQSESESEVLISRKGGGRRKGRRRATRRPMTNKQAQTQTSSTSSSGGSAKVVEIAVFTDEMLYKTWSGRYPTDTTTKMNQYVLAVINNMNALYKQPSMTESISFRLVHLEIATSKPKTPKTHGGHASRYLKSFCSYAAEKNRLGSLWDHALLLTGHDLNEGGNNSTAGIAWFSTMCINSLSCSVIEGSTFGSTFVTSHEIGHSLGMEHDGDAPRNSKCDANSYLMSPTTGGGKTDWSKSSMKNMKDFLKKGYMGNPAPKCIPKKGQGNAIHFGNTKLPGQQFDAEVQCSVECKGCTPYRTSSAPYNDMCHLLFCQEKTSKYYSTIWSTHPALEGTSCGRGKMCKLGTCQ